MGAATGRERSTFGATADIIATRDLVRRIAGGTSDHVEHARTGALPGVEMNTRLASNASVLRNLPKGGKLN